jgi:hypothetical protein
MKLYPGLFEKKKFGGKIAANFHAPETHLEFRKERNRTQIIL